MDTLEVQGNEALLCGTLTTGQRFSQHIVDLTNGVKKDRNADRSLTVGEDLCGKDFLNVPVPANAALLTSDNWTVRDNS